MKNFFETAFVAVLVLTLVVVASCDDGIQPAADADCIDIGGGADYAGQPCPDGDGDADSDSDSDGDLEACPAIEIDSVPQGAEVIVDGTPSGAFTPTTLVPPKGQEIELSFLLDGYDPSAVRVRVTAECSLSPEGPFVLYPSVEGTDGNARLCNTDSGICGDYSVAFISQEGPELTGEISGAPISGDVSPEGEVTLVESDTTLVGHRVNLSLLEGTWSNSLGDEGVWTLTW